MEHKNLNLEDHKILKDLQTNLQLQKTAARITELEYENLILKLYVKYGLKESDSINLSTGDITRSSQESNQ